MDKNMEGCEELFLEPEYNTEISIRSWETRKGVKIYLLNGKMPVVETDEAGGKYGIGVFDKSVTPTII